MIGTARNRALAGRPLPTEHSIAVSGPRWNREHGWHVALSGHDRAIFCAQLALTHVSHEWLDMHGLTTETDMMAGPDYRASAEQARAFYESYVYDPANDPENVDCGVILTDENSWWVLGGGK